MAAVEIGTVVAGLRIDAVAGCSGTGVVYRATHLALDRTVAVKVVAPELADDPEFRERFKRESALAASIDHPHMAPVYHAGEQDGRLFVTMRFIEGVDLRRVIQQTGALDPRRAAEIVSQVAGALEAAHARGLVHRAIRPANILIGGGGRVRAYLTDFGLATPQTGGLLTGASTLSGGADYLAPEQIEGRQVDGRADVYALGCVLFESLTGRVPFPRATPAATMWAHLGTAPPTLRELAAHLPHELDEVLARALAKRREQRFATAGELGRSVLTATIVPVSATRVGGTGAAGLASPAVSAVSVAHPELPPPRVSPDLAQRPTPPDPAGPPDPPSPVTTPAPAAPDPVRARPPTGSAVPRRNLVIVLAVVVVALVLLSASVVVRLSAGAPVRPPAPTAPAAPAGEVLGPPIPVGAGSGRAVAAGGFLWTAGADSLTKIDPTTGATTVVPLGAAPTLLAAGPGAVWVRTDLTTVVRVDVATGQVGALVATGVAVVDQLAVGGGYLWLSHSAEGTVSRLDLATGLVVGQPVTVGAGPYGMQYVDRSGRLYVVNSQDHTLLALDGATGGPVGAPVPVAGANGVIRQYEQTLYLGTPSGLTPVDEPSLTVGRPVPLAPGYAAFVVGGASAWVAYPVDGAVRRYDLGAATLRGRPVSGLGRVDDVVFVDGVLYVLDGEGARVTRVRPAG